MPTNTIKLHRVLRCSAEKLYRALLDANALCKWLPPHGFIATVEHLNAHEGGTFKMAFTNFSTGSCHSFGGTYLELIPHQLIRYTDQFDDPTLTETMIVTIQLTEVSCGTEIYITQANIPSVIPTEACYLGWQESLQLLTLLVEATIPDNE